MSEDDVLTRINAGGFEALDFGSGAGHSAEFIRKRFGYQAIAGIELDAKKVVLARNAGLAVVQADATTIPLGKGVVSAAFMFHFLEHLKSLAEARAVVLQACRAAREFVLIRQPFFGADEELMAKGVKLAWSTWRAHANKMTTLEFHTLLSEFKEARIVRDFVINYAIPIESTEDRQVLPLTAGGEDLFYDKAAHGPKPNIALTGVFREVCVVCSIGERVPLAKIETAARVAQRVYPLAPSKSPFRSLRGAGRSISRALRLRRAAKT